MDPSDSPKRLPSPTSAQLASTSHTSKNENQPGQPFAHPFESDFRSPEPSYEDLSPPLADAPAVQGSQKGWWEDLLDTYSPTREQAYVKHTFTITERLT
jgi:hypothetical protein